MARWQRRWSYAVLGACGATGLVWFVLSDAFGIPAPRLVPWWIAHGITGLLGLLAIGSALPQHVVVAWRHHRNRVLGSLALATLGIAAALVLALFYGLEGWHTAAHWTHVVIGIAAAVVFPVHVLTGRRSAGQLPAKALHRER